MQRSLCAHFESATPIFAARIHQDWPDLYELGVCFVIAAGLQQLGRVLEACRPSLVEEIPWRYSDSWGFVITASGTAAFGDPRAGDRYLTRHARLRWIPVVTFITDVQYLRRPAESHFAFGFLPIFHGIEVCSFIFKSETNFTFDPLCLFGSHQNLSHGLFCSFRAASLVQARNWQRGHCGSGMDVHGACEVPRRDANADLPVATIFP